jgi:hypothetical protein
MCYTCCFRFFTAYSFKKLKESILVYREIVTVWSKGVSPYRALVATFILGGGLFIIPIGIYLLHVYNS